MAQNESFTEDRLGEDFTINTLELSSNEQTASYMHNALLRYILLHLPKSDESEKELFCKLQSFTSQSSGYTRHISDIFVKEYKPDKAIWWYTEDSFLYEALNKALREQDVDFLYDTRHFLTDLHQRLQKEHLNFDVKKPLYRGMKLDYHKAEALEKNLGKLIHFDQFISTSTEEAVAKGFIRNWNRNSVPILFHIDISSAAPLIHTEDEPIACIQEFSQRPNEKEVLLPPSSVFRLMKVTKKRDMDTTIEIWHMSLELTTVRDQDLQDTYQRLKKEVDIDPVFPTDIVQLAKLLRRLDKADLATKYYQIGLRDPIIGSNYVYQTTIYTDLALICRLKKDYRIALEYLGKAENSVKNLKLQSYDRPFRMIMGNRAVVFKYLNKYNNALACIYQTLFMEEEAGVQNSAERATTLNNLATLSMELGIFNGSIIYLKWALEIQEKALPKHHPEIARTYNNMSCLYNIIGNGKEAEKYAREAGRIHAKVLPGDHQSVATTKKNLGVAQLQLEQYDEAYCNFEEAGDIWSKTFSRNDPELKDIEAGKNIALKMCQ